jgi:hypothetical protein
LIVRVQGTRGDSDGLSVWGNGEHEGFEGKITAMNDRSEILLTGLDVAVPVSYLVPVRPTRARGKVVVLYGKHKGKDATLQDGGGGVWLIQVSDSSVLDDIPEDRICMWESD